MNSKKILWRIVPWGAAIVTAGCWAYSLAVRFTDFLFASRTEKITIFGSLLLIASILSAWFFLVVIAPSVKAIPKKTASILLGISCLAVALAFSISYQPPPFPEYHTLSITTLEEINPLSKGSAIEILSLSTVSLPAQKHKRIPTNQLELNGAWQGTSSGFGIFTSNGLGTSISFKRFMQAGMVAEFQTGPKGGIVQITWDEDEQALDLYTPQPGIYSAVLEPKLNWRRADLTRKVLVGGALIADFLGLAVLVAAIFLLLYKYFSGQKLTIRQPGLLFLCLVLVAALQFAVIKINQEVVFENLQIEAIVREVLNKPTGDIYQRQMLTIVKLDASGRKITSLEGIEKLPNLTQLNLRDNQIIDIRPLEQLKLLKKLNLRNNEINDLSPVSKLTGLTYLNVSFNPGIETIEPLKNLTNLRTLIIENVPVGDDINILENFKKLGYLNLHGSEVSDLAPIATLKNLEYLNLYSNPGIATIAPLKDLDNLQTLILANDPIGGEIEILANLHKLKYLNLRKTGLTDISALASLTNLEYLNLHSDPKIQSIEPIKNLSRLRTLILRDVPIGNQIDVINDLPDLVKLNIRNCGVADIGALGNLMAHGALQDNKKTKVMAEVDIRDNLIPRSAGDQYASVRPYWENIAIRQPVGLPFFAGLHDVNFSQPAGFYEENFLLELSSDDPGAKIYYTLDGTEPTEASLLYTEPILIASREGEPNIFSAVESIAADWNKPEVEVTKATIVRAKAIDDQTGATSAIMTQTYFVGKAIKEKYNLPIVSLVTAPQNFFDEDSGIYVLGKPYMEQADADITEDERQAFANYNQHGRVWERPISIELFESNGDASFTQNGGVRIHGGGSRRYPQKTLRFYARSEYDAQEFFDYPLFTGHTSQVNNQNTPVYKTFLLRNSGQDWMKSIFRDAFVQSLVNDTRLATQAARPVIAFLNGEYWGIYTLQERYDEYYLANHYKVEPGKSVILRQNGVLFRGEAGDERLYSMMMTFIRKNGLSDPQNYKYIQTQMDVDNYIDYLITEIYAGNDDWPDNNIYLWRMKTDQYEPNAPYGQDGRWRWMIFDMDFGFGLKGGAEDYKLNTIEVAKQEGWGGFLFRELLKNNEFRSEFASRFLDQLSTTYAPERVIAILDNWEITLQPEIEENFQRWSPEPDALAHWEAEVGVMREFAQKRPVILRELIMEQFGTDLK